MPPWPEAFASTPADRRSLLRLSALRTLSPRALYALALRHDTASTCVEAILDGEAGSVADRDRLRSVSPEAVAAGVRACGGRVVAPGAAEYPASLEDLADPPVILFVRGAPLQPLYPRVAVVGARRCTNVGADVAREIGAGLAGAGITLVSGGARGIDQRSHEGSLLRGGPTVAVMGCGIDRLYPASNRKLLEEVERHGALVSEYPPGVPAEAFRFPARNRIIAALAEAVVVVEGATGSGSLITTEHAADLGRSVFAVPGIVTSPLSEVPLQLIRDGAVMIRGADDLLLDLGRIDPNAKRRDATEQLSAEERAVLDALSGPTLPERVAADLGRDLGAVLGILVGLELRGLVRAAGGRFERRVASAV